MSISDETRFSAPPCPECFDTGFGRYANRGCPTCQAQPAPKRCDCLIVDLGLTPQIAYCALHEAAPEMHAALLVALAYMESRGTYDTAEIAAPLRAALERTKP